MTTPLDADDDDVPSNWCPACQECCHDHSQVCTVCGERLESQPPPPPPPMFSTPASIHTPPMRRLLQPPTLPPPPPRLRLAQQQAQQAHLQAQQLQAAAQRHVDHNSTPNLQELTEMQENSRDLLELLRSLRQRIHSLQAAVEGAGTAANFNNSNGGNGDWQLDMLPPEAWDPQAGGVSLLRSRPVAAEYLENIPRIVLDANSSLFHDITLRLHASTDANLLDESSESSLVSLSSADAVLHPILGEFGTTAANDTTTTPADTSTDLLPPPPPPRPSLQRVPLIVAEPKTGKGGDLSEATKAEIQQVLANQNDVAAESPPACIVYMERGDNITFVQKAMMAQRAGASAVIIGNNTDVTWPYIMKDTAGEALTLGLTIPVVMIQQRDAKTMLQQYRQRRGSPKGPEAAADTPFFVSLDMTLHSQQQECVVCREVFEVGHTVMRLPSCGHVFHEPCAMAWLTRNHTCPYCRGEMPTEPRLNDSMSSLGAANAAAAAAAARPPPPPPLGTSQHRSAHASSIQDLYR